MSRNLRRSGPMRLAEEMRRALIESGWALVKAEFKPFPISPFGQLRVDREKKPAKTRGIAFRYACKG